MNLYLKLGSATLLFWILCLTAHYFGPNINIDSIELWFYLPYWWSFAVFIFILTQLKNK